jgi:hypothetical protein
MGLATVVIMVEELPPVERAISVPSNKLLLIWQSMLMGYLHSLIISNRKYIRTQIPPILEYPLSHSPEPFYRGQLLTPAHSRYEYASLNGGDRDFGSSGAALLIAGGKSGKIYVMDANNLGGFNMGSGGGDAGEFRMFHLIEEMLNPSSASGHHRVCQSSERCG